MVIGSALGRCAALALSLSLVLLCASSDARSEMEATETAQCGEDNASSLLQSKSNISQGDLEDEKDKEEEALNPVGTVNWDGQNHFSVTRHEVSGLPAEILFRLPSNQFVVNGPGVDYSRNSTHMFVAYDVMYNATFVRDMHQIGSYEYGVAKWVFEDNPVSVFGDAVVVGAGEKWHTLSHEGAWNTESIDKVRAVQAEREPATDELAALSGLSRNAAMNMWVLLNDLGPRILAAGIDPNVMMDVMAFAAAPEDVMADDSAFAWRMWNVSANLTWKHNEFIASMEPGEVPEPVSTALSCYHLHRSPLIVQESTGFWWPLGKKLATVRGQTVFEPLQSQSNMVGTSVAYYNANDDCIDVYQGVASQSLVIDPSVPSGALQTPSSANLWVGNTDAGDRPIVPDGRPELPAHPAALSAMVWSLYQTWMSAPADYHYLSTDPAETCSQAELHAIKTELRAANFMMMLRGPNANAATKNEVVRIITAMIGCSVDYLKTDAEDSHDYGPIEALVFIHGTVEFKAGVLMRGWNSLELASMGLQKNFTRGGKGGKGGKGL